MKLLIVLLALALVGIFFASYISSYKEDRNDYAILLVNELQAELLENRSTESGDYGVFQFDTMKLGDRDLKDVADINQVVTEDKQQFCLYVKLTASDMGEYYVATDSGSGYVNDEPKTVSDCKDI